MTRTKPAKRKPARKPKLPPTFGTMREPAASEPVIGWTHQDCAYSMRIFGHATIWKHRQAMPSKPMLVIDPATHGVYDKATERVVKIADAQAALAFTGRLKDKEKTSALLALDTAGLTPGSILRELGIAPPAVKGESAAAQRGGSQ